MPPVSRGRTYLSNCLKKLDGVKIGTIYTKWGNLNENLLNRVIAVKIIELGGKNWNLLKKISLSPPIPSYCKYEDLDRAPKFC
jgi:hypothetical protein